MTSDVKIIRLFRIFTPVYREITILLEVIKYSFHIRVWEMIGKHLFDIIILGYSHLREYSYQGIVAALDFWHWDLT